MSRVEKQLCGFSEAAHGFGFGRKIFLLNIRADPQLDIAAVKQIALKVTVEKFFFQGPGKLRFADAGPSCYQDEGGPVSIAVRPVFRVNITGDPIRVSVTRLVPQFVNFGDGRVSGNNSAAADVVTVDEDCASFSVRPRLASAIRS